MVSLKMHKSLSSIILNKYDILTSDLIHLLLVD